MAFRLPYIVKEDTNMGKTLAPSMPLKLEELREQLTKGEISREEISDILELAIYAEASKSDADINGAWLDACAQLMLEVDKEEVSSLSKHSETTWRAIRAEIHEEKRQIRWLKPALRIAACLVLFFGIRIIAHFTWFQGSQLQEEQMYFVEGHEVSLENEANADEVSGSMSECVTDDFSELCGFLGYIPSLPTWIPDGWQLVEYFVNRDEIGQMLAVSYKKSDEQYLLSYVQEWVYELDALAISIPQDGAGYYTTLDNGLHVYITTNMDRPVAVWTTERSCITVSGPITNEDLTRIILSIQ